MGTNVERRRVRVSATLDPQLVRAVDAYVAAHEGLDRSAVLDEALRLWYARQQEEAIAAQYAPAGPDDEPPADEWATWKAIQAAAGARVSGQGEEEA